MATLCHVICDYGIGDGAFSEVIQKLHFFAPDWQYQLLSVPAFSTLATGFWIAQLGEYQSSDKVIIFSNTAPRHDDEHARKDNEGEKFVYAELKNGTKIGAVNAGWAFAFVKNDIVKFSEVQTMNKGSQFRSRDFYPESFVATFNNELELGNEISIDTIPEIPEKRIAYIDGYGNIKTTIQHNDVKLNPGQSMKVKINGIEKEAIYSDGIFNIPFGQMVFAPGSSGERDNPFMEISVRTSHVGDISGASEFGFPSVESGVEVGK